MRTLWIFGDSFSHSFKITTDAIWSNNYTNWKGYQPDSFGDIISNKLNLQLVNKSKQGADNYSIFERVCEASVNIKPGDIVIIGWSRRTRFRIVNPYHNWWKSIIKVDNKDDVYSYMSKQSITEIMLNRESVLYSNEVNNWINLLNVTFKNNTIINWTWSKYDYELNAINLSDMCIITKESNGEHINDHYGEQGHKELSDIFLEIIQKN